MVANGMWIGWFIWVSLQNRIIDTDILFLLLRDRPRILSSAEPATMIGEKFNLTAERN